MADVSFETTHWQWYCMMWTMTGSLNASKIQFPGYY